MSVLRICFDHLVMAHLLRKLLMAEMTHKMYRFMFKRNYKLWTSARNISITLLDFPYRRTNKSALRDLTCAFLFGSLIETGIFYEKSNFNYVYLNLILRLAIAY